MKNGNAAKKRWQCVFALLFFTSGCSTFLAALSNVPPEKPPISENESTSTYAQDRENQERQRQERLAAMAEEKRKKAAEIEAQEQAIFDDLDRLRTEIATTKKVVSLAKPFSERVLDASRTTRARSGKIDALPLFDEAARYLEESIRQSPSLETFASLEALPPGDVTDIAVVASCNRVRHLVPPEKVLDFMATCLDGAGGDAKKLTWPNVRRDVAAYLEDEKERRLAAAAAAEKDRAIQAKNERYVAAAVFASGRCRFSDCMKNGWTSKTADGDVDVNCSFSSCFKDGWTARFPDGSQASTRCSFSDCTKDGWTTRFADGTEATTRCSFSNCLKDGWSTSLPGGESITTRCLFSDCSTNGWETNLPGGQTIRCRCNFGKCFEDGATCG